MADSASALEIPRPSARRSPRPRGIANTRTAAARRPRNSHRSTSDAQHARPRGAPALGGRGRARQPAPIAARTAAAPVPDLEIQRASRRHPVVRTWYSEPPRLTVSGPSTATRCGRLNLLLSTSRRSGDDQRDRGGRGPGRGFIVEGNVAPTPGARRAAGSPIPPPLGQLKSELRSLGEPKSGSR